MGATITCSKEGQMVVVDINDWSSDPMLVRYPEVKEWARNVNPWFLAEDDVPEEGVHPDSHRFYVLKCDFVDFWKFLWSNVPPSEESLAKWEKWLRKSGAQGSVKG